LQLKLEVLQDWVSTLRQISNDIVGMLRRQEHFYLQGLQYSSEDNCDKDVPVEKVCSRTCGYLVAKNVWCVCVIFCV